MRLVTGYTDGRPNWSENIPGGHAYASTSRGGLTLGQALASVAPRNAPKPVKVPDRWYLAAPRCGIELSGGPCARAAGHKGGTDHLTRAQMDAENARRSAR